MTKKRSMMNWEEKRKSRKRHHLTIMLVMLVLRQYHLLCLEVWQVLSRMKVENEMNGCT